VLYRDVLLAVVDFEGFLVVLEVEVEAPSVVPCRGCDGYQSQRMMMDAPWRKVDLFEGLCVDGALQEEVRESLK
jgi:hypothetical protein